MIRFCFRAIRWLFFAYLLIVLVACLGESYIYYQPTKMPDVPPEERVNFAEYMPERLVMEEVDFSSSDGTELHGILFLSGDYVGENTIPILFCHGNGEWMMRHRGWVFPRYEPGPAEFAFFLFDYRAFGYSKGRQGELCEKVVYADARSARKWLAERVKKPEPEIVIMGHSLGGAVAVELAQDGTPGLALFATFDTLPRVAQQHVPIFPATLLMRNRFDSETKIRDISAPLFYAHGTGDWVVPYVRGEKLYAAAGNPKKFVTLTCGHNDLPRDADLMEEVKDFVRECVKERQMLPAAED